MEKYRITPINNCGESNLMDSPVPKNELKVIEASLREWRNPVKFGSIAHELNERMPNKQFQRQPGLQFFREAVNAADFAMALGCDLVRLGEEDQSPDFEISKAGVVKGYELTEAMEEGRRRGDEDWDSNEIELVPVGEWHKAAEMIPSQLRAAVKRKVKKDYPPNEFGLVIYLSITGTYGLRQTEIEANFHAATELAKDKFNEVWIAWGIKHYLLWRNGNASREIFQAPLNLQAYG